MGAIDTGSAVANAAGIGSAKKQSEPSITALKVPALSEGSFEFWKADVYKAALTAYLPAQLPIITTDASISARPSTFVTECLTLSSLFSEHSLGETNW